jgi:rubrerythrin
VIKGIVETAFGAIGGLIRIAKDARARRDRERRASDILPDELEATKARERAHEALRKAREERPVADGVVGCERCGKPSALVGDRIPADDLCPWCRGSTEGSGQHVAELFRKDPTP